MVTHYNHGILYASRNSWLSSKGEPYPWIQPFAKNLAVGEQIATAKAGTSSSMRTGNPRHRRSLMEIPYYSWSAKVNHFCLTTYRRPGLGGRDVAGPPGAAPKPMRFQERDRGRRVSAYTASELATHSRDRHAGVGIQHPGYRRRAESNQVSLALQTYVHASVES